jgi:transposase-like protein
MGEDMCHRFSHQLENIEQIWKVGLRMNCPLCHADGLVIHTDGTRRRRECVTCRYRWTTVELAEQELRRLRRVADVAAELTAALRGDYVANLPR